MKSLVMKRGSHVGARRKKHRLKSLRRAKVRGADPLLPRGARGESYMKNYGKREIVKHISVLIYKKPRMRGGADNGPPRDI